MFDNRVLRKIVGLKMEGVIGDLHNEVHDLVCNPTAHISA